MLHHNPPLTNPVDAIAATPQDANKDLLAASAYLTATISTIIATTVMASIPAIPLSVSITTTALSIPIVALCLPMSIYHLIRAPFSLIYTPIIRSTALAEKS